MHLLMLMVTVCWASNIIAGKEALTGFGALALAQLRVLGASIIFVIGFLASGRMRRLRLSRGNGSSWWRWRSNGIALNQLTFIGGMARSTVAHTGLIVALGPVMVLAIAVVVRLEALTAWKFAGMMIAFAGVGILTADKAGQGSGGHGVGDLILLASTLVFAIYTVLMKEVANRLRRADPEHSHLRAGRSHDAPILHPRPVGYELGRSHLGGMVGAGVFDCDRVCDLLPGFCLCADGIGGVARRGLQLFAARHRQRLGHLAAFGAADLKRC